VWKELIIVPILKNGNKTDCNNYRGISLLPTTYKLLSNILLSRLIPYAKEIIGDHQCVFRRNKSNIDHIFCNKPIKMNLAETYSRVRVGKNVSERFPIRNGLKQGDALTPVLFNFVLGFAIRRVKVNQDGLKLNGTH